MSNKPLYLGNTPQHVHAEAPTGDFVSLNGNPFYRIQHYQQMRPFFMSIVSSEDHWLFISSNGALTAGRRNPQHALFPYYTDDKIHDSPELTGSKTLLIIEKAGKRYLWEPFSARYQGVYPTRHTLYKSIYGHEIRFEAYNESLGLSFSYAWKTSEQFGFVKQAWLRNHQHEAVQVRMLDGLQNLLPAGVNLAMQTELSTLVDAYKKNELDPESGLGLFVLSSILVDRPEPSEALMATTVWAAGLEPMQHLLSSRQLDAFRRGEAIQAEQDVRAERGAYFIQSEFTLTAQAEQAWIMVAEVEQGPVEIAALREALKQKDELRDQVLADVDRGSEKLRQLVGTADGLQASQDALSTTRHFANVMFNIMRGGIFDQHYIINLFDFKAFVRHFNQGVAKAHHSFLQSLPEACSLSQLLSQAKAQADTQLLRLCYEYLPLTFSRRHGDPSRPWNFFSIDLEDSKGKKQLNYQGNWRDIFQNWEALALSYPGFVESMIGKFVNASTADGYNPYRITRDGIDWEEEDPDDPWAYIGYWGDHQIIYLLKLLEISASHHPRELQDFLRQEIFSYAQVPYRIKAYEALLSDPHNTIVFDQELAKRIDARVQKIGADGKLVLTPVGEVYQVNLSEKLLVSALAKVANFIPEAGIWMNTQRPEWNDANNALVGYGVSMVTLCYLRRYQLFLHQLFSQWEANSQVSLSEEVAEMLASMTEVLTQHQEKLQASLSNQDRKTILDGLGQAASQYRQKIYAVGFSGRKQGVSREKLLQFLNVSVAYMDHSIRANQRPDNLYHAYNLMEVENEGEISIHPLYEMLEGQVAVLSSGLLSPAASIEVLDALKASRLFREDQYSYLLYPDRQLPRYLQKNQIPAQQVTASPLLQALVQQGDRSLIEQDIHGKFHFNGAFRNKDSVAQALDYLTQEGWADLVTQERQRVLDIFESVFQHRAFTGRSGTFYGYEGLGCIYWHMVSKLLLAIGENYYRALEQGADEAELGALVAHYYAVRAGIGLNKSPALYGAFPTDPYSHTPGNAGAQQPGMTGQVKEDILARWLELGLRVKEGQLHIEPALLRRSEFHAQARDFTYYSLKGEKKHLELPPNSLAFTYCQVPIVYTLSEEIGITFSLRPGQERQQESLVLGPEISQSLFDRSDQVINIQVRLNPKLP